MKSNYVRVLNLILENEIEQAKTELETIIADYNKSNHNVKRSVYDHDTSNIFEAVGLDEIELRAISFHLIAEMSVENLSRHSHLIEMIESKPWPTNQKMVMFNFISNVLKFTDGSKFEI